MKKLTLFLLFIGICTSSLAQLKQGDTISTFKSIIPIEKQNLLSNIDLIANMQFAYRADWYEDELETARFRMEQFRLEIRGYVTKSIYFRFRHRYTSNYEPQSVDKIIKGVDFAYVTIKLGEKWTSTIGKTYADWGGIEFDLNPIDVYEYSDIIENADNFLSGIGVNYSMNENHGFGFQLLNPRTQTFEEIYGDDLLLQGEIEPSKVPLAGVVTWRGKFLDGKLSTLWHYSLFNEAKDIYKNYMAFGQQLTLDKWIIAYDYKLSLEDIDRTGVIRNLLPDDQGAITLRNTRYQSHWATVHYKIADKWQLSFTGFIDLSAVKNLEGDYEKVRTGYGYIPSVEFFPWEDYNFKFFINYVGRSYRPSTFSEQTLGLTDENTSRIMIGFISPLNVL